MQGMPSDDLAISVHRHRLLRLDVELDASGRADLPPRAMRSGAESAQHQHKLPEVFHFQAIEVEMSIIYLQPNALFKEPESELTRSSY